MNYIEDLKMTQRVGYIKGISENPAIIIAPHGNDDTNTDLFAETIQNELQISSVINYGWERSKYYDYYKDKANCNSISHVHEDVIKQEFLDPILTSYDYSLDTGYLPALFIIHGVHDSIKNTPNAANLDLIIGTGYGSKKSCDDWSKHFFCKMLTSKNFNVFLGKENGQYAGNSNDNLNQILNHYKNKYAISEQCSFQIEIVKSLRDTKQKTIESAKRLADSINAFMLLKNDTLNQFSIMYIDYPTI